MDAKEAVREFEKIRIVLEMTTFESSLEKKYPNFADVHGQILANAAKMKKVKSAE